MTQLRHDNIVQYLGCAVVETFVLIVMEYIPGGSLQGVMSQFGKELPQTSIQRFTRDVVEGLCYIHKNKVVHRDLEPANVLITHEGQCKLSDFGASAELKKTAAAGRKA